MSRLLGVESYTFLRLLGTQSAHWHAKSCYGFFQRGFDSACDLPILIWIFIFSSILVALLLIDEDNGAQDYHLCHNAKEWPQCCQLV